MEYWDWEVLETFVTSEMFVVSDHGPLFGPVTHFRLERNRNLDLILKTKSSGDSTSNEVERPIGSVYQADSVVKLTSRTGSWAVATGVIPRKYRKMLDGESGQGVTKQRSSIHSLQWTSGDAPKSSYIIDWVGNVGSFIWPDNDDLKETGEKRRTLSSPHKQISLSVPINSGGDAVRASI